MDEVYTSYSNSGRTASAPPSAFPFAIDSTGRYMKSAQGTPTWLWGDGGAQMLCQRLPTVVTEYLTDRAGKGFNALWMHVVANDQDFANADGKTDDGIAPFTDVLNGDTVDSGPNYDFTTPNEAYFARLDAILTIATGLGFLVLLDVMENDSYLQVYENNGVDNMGVFAAYLANRYRTYTNIVWMTGNDFQTWNTNGFDNELAQSLMSNIQTTDSTKLQTTELDFFMSYSLQNTLLLPYTDLSGVYTYYPAYFEGLTSYNDNSKGHPAPWHMIESYYENWVNSGLFPQVATDLMMRKQLWWSFTCGASGHFYGSTQLSFPPDWQDNIDTTAVAQIGLLKTFAATISWWLLIPDQTNAFLTAGYGTPTGNKTGNIQTDNYCTAGITADGSLGLIYCPANTTVSVDLTKMRGTTLARWLDPTNGTFTTIGSFTNTASHNFTMPGNNSEGDPDYALVLTA